jgi:hypothetical protein
MPSTPIFISIPKVVAGLVTIGAIASSSLLIVTGRAIAQDASSVDPLEDLRTNDTDADPFSGSSSQGDIYNLIHRMILNNGTSMEQFSQQQNENLGVAAEDFRNRQRELLIQSAPEAGVEDESSLEPEAY